MRAAFALLLLVASGAQAQEPAGRGPAEQADLIALAQALGESHALTQACAPDDQTWRARMQRMIEVEAPDADFEAELADRFNAGFQARRDEFPTCTAAVAKARAAVAAEGRSLSERLARSR